MSKVVSPSPIVAVGAAQTRFASLVAMARRNMLIVVPGAMLALMAFIAIFAPYLGTVDPTSLNPAARLQDPSAAHWFGTDMLGRDLYSRVIYGSRVSLIVGLSVAFFSSVAGLVVGMMSGFIRWLDPIIMRIMDGMMSIPPILLAIALVALTGGSMQNVIIAITIAEIPRTTRLVRSVVLSIREEPYVDAAITAGSSTPKILLKHILPNTVAPITVQATYVCAAAMIAESILSFIGAGLPPIVPSWGNIIADARSLWQMKPLMIFFPALFLSICVLAVNLLGDGLRELIDPRLVKGQ